MVCIRRNNGWNTLVKHQPMRILQINVFLAQANDSHHALVQPFQDLNLWHKRTQTKHLCQHDYAYLYYASDSSSLESLCRQGNRTDPLIMPWLKDSWNNSWTWSRGNTVAASQAILAVTATPDVTPWMGSSSSAGTSSGNTSGGHSGTRSQLMQQELSKHSLIWPLIMNAIVSIDNIHDLGWEFLQVWGHASPPERWTEKWSKIHEHDPSGSDERSPEALHYREERSLHERNARHNLAPWIANLQRPSTLW